MSKDKAKKYLAEHKDVQQVFATTDGFLFLKKIHARAHAVTLENKEVSSFKQEGSQEPKTPNTLEGNLGEVKERVQAIDDVELLEALSLQEEKDANRKGALEAIASRIDELTQTEETPEEGDNQEND